MTTQARERTNKLFMWTAIALGAALVSMLVSLAMTPPAVLGMILGGIFVAALVTFFFLYLAACESLSKAKGYNPIIVATALIGLIPPLIILLLLPDISSSSKSGQ